jgi:hypothetical protein
LGFQRWWRFLGGRRAQWDQGEPTEESRGVGRRRKIPAWRIGEGRTTQPAVGAGGRCVWRPEPSRGFHHVARPLGLGLTRGGFRYTRPIRWAKRLKAGPSRRPKNQPTSGCLPEAR